MIPRPKRLRMRSRSAVRPLPQCPFLLPWATCVAHRGPPRPLSYFKDEHGRDRGTWKTSPQEAPVEDHHAWPGPCPEVRLSQKICRGHSGA
eukprot:2694837-Pyramimonas_sp.AAC.1